MDVADSVNKRQKPAAVQRVKYKNTNKNTLKVRFFNATVMPNPSPTHKHATGKAAGSDKGRTKQLQLKEEDKRKREGLEMRCSRFN